MNEHSPSMSALSTRVLQPPPRHLFNRWVDFALLGGGSVVVLCTLAAFYPRTEEARIGLAATMLFLCHFVNHPHFAHSYQIFYRDFATKAFSPESVLRRRYVTAGIAVPAALATFFAVAFAQGSAAVLGLAANVMFFTVGWHYAKQGYGILMVDAANVSTRLAAGERRRLLWNTHLAWIAWYLMTNDALAVKNYWGLKYLVFDVPDPVLAGVLAAVTISTALVCRDFWRLRHTGHSLPVNGIIAYAVAVYIWLPIGRVDPILLLVVPFFHSLQYLGVVWRYQFNVETDRVRTASAGTGGSLGRLRGAAAGFVRFTLAGVLLGAVGFWWGPEFLDATVDYDRAVFGATAFVFMGWCFINIHHYFIDNVIWRRENTDVHRHLFAEGVAKDAHSLKRDRRHPAAGRDKPVPYGSSV